MGLESELLREWMRRLVELTRSLHKATREAAWFLRVRIKVLRYLISRYGRQQADRASASSTSPSAYTASAPRKAPRAFFIHFPVGGSKPRKSSETIHALLMDIQQTLRENGY